MAFVQEDSASASACKLSAASFANQLMAFSASATQSMVSNRLAKRPSANSNRCSTLNPPIVCCPQRPLIHQEVKNSSLKSEMRISSHGSKYRSGASFKHNVEASALNAENYAALSRSPNFPNSANFVCPATSTSGCSSGTTASIEYTSVKDASSASSKLKRKSQRNWLTCTVCNKKFDRPSLLKRHMRTHTGEKPHACDVCSKAFSTSSSLNTHRRIHSGEKPHACATCGKRFTASSNLYYHRMTHNKEKPHKCHQCPKSFPTPGDLRNHMYVHNAEWPFKCPICQRGFSKVTNLKNHLYLHNGEKPFECDKCGKKFALHCNLKAHSRTHEKGGSDYAYDSVADERRDELLSGQQLAINERRFFDHPLASPWLAAGVGRSLSNHGNLASFRQQQHHGYSLQHSIPKRANNFRSVEELAVSAYADADCHSLVDDASLPVHSRSRETMDIEASGKSLGSEANNNENDLLKHAAQAIDLKLYYAALQSMPVELLEAQQSGLLSLLKPLHTLANIVATGGSGNA